ncbi:BadF/BadG/BcrA/BcrD ATPase family protein [Lapidilactobacillus luobeiensis]|uniref:BadF/BadG/BcrA/BcrD ATPase family protein n=1 Tax=Lapidilactobacillus luobeiensis TaxID=2950371 RepID=UPI0021C3C754|nr:BadF/BadG/BcrA/BcrD ATPase family protein [Lapidilactobacillus luobeiensis]
MQYLIGVDSGGTHIVGQALTSTTGTILAQKESGVGNILLAPQQTITNLKTVIKGLLHELADHDCQMILLGIAGVETVGNSAQLAADFTQSFKIPTYVISDAQLALLNGLEGHDGTLVIAGTGSVIYGRQNQQLFRYGGWGNLLGDTGSAYQIAISALKAMLKSFDDQQSNDLTTPLLTALNATDPRQAAHKIYTLDRPEIAGLAKVVAAVADQGSATAQQVLVTQAAALAAETTQLLHRFSAPLPAKIALSGSVLVYNGFYRKTFLSHLHTSYPQLEPIVVDTNNARGAIFWSRWQKK